MPAAGLIPIPSVPLCAAVSPPRAWVLAGTLTTGESGGNTDRSTTPMSLTGTEPPFAGLSTTRRCLIPIGDGAGLLLQFAGVGASSNDTGAFDLRLWSPLIAPSDNTEVNGVKKFTIEHWHPTMLGSITVTAGATQAGVSNGLVLGTSLYADTITIGSDRGFAGQLAVSGPAAADELAVTLRVDCLNYMYLEVRKTGGTSSLPWQVLAKSFTGQ